MKRSPHQIWIIEDDPFFAQATEKRLQQALRCDVRLFSTGEAALSARAEDSYLVILDYQIGAEPGQQNGLDILRELRRRRPELPVLVVSGACDVATTVSFFREGAWDFIVKGQEGCQDALMESVHALMRLRESQDYLEWVKAKKQKEGVRLVFTALLAAGLLLATLSLV